MPRGAKPKMYPTDLVERVRSLYAGGLTQVEVAADTGLTQKVVWNLMRRHGIERRPQIKRDQRGPKNSSWRGAGAGYAAMHLRVVAARGAPKHCEQCGTTNEAKRYEWASVSRRYDDVNDYRRLCASCHKRFDGIVRNLRKEVPR